MPISSPAAGALRTSNSSLGPLGLVPLLSPAPNTRETQKKELYACFQDLLPLLVQFSSIQFNLIPFNCQVSVLEPIFLSAPSFTSEAQRMLHTAGT